MYLFLVKKRELHSYVERTISPNLLCSARAFPIFEKDIKFKYKPNKSTTLETST